MRKSARQAKRGSFLCEKIESLLNDEYGGAIVEATIVLPVIIFAILSYMLMAVHFAGATFEVINANEYLIYRDGIYRDKRDISFQKGDFEEEEANIGLGKILQVKKSFEGENDFMNRILKSEIETCRYTFSEKKIIWYKDLFDEVVSR